MIFFLIFSTPRETQRPRSTRQQSPSPSPPPALPIKSSHHHQQHHRRPQEPEKPPKLPEKKKAVAPPPQPVMQPEPDYDDEYDDDEEYDADDMVDSSKEWQCLHCTYLNSLEVEICEMCSKSRRSVASSHHDDDDDFVSGNSQMEDPYESEEEQIEEDENKIQCPKCTLYNPANLTVCTICGASLHKAPIETAAKNHHRRPQSSASRSSGHSRAHR